jgi:hypothetical protein
MCGGSTTTKPSPTPAPFPPGTLTKYERELASEAASALVNGFTWSESAEGGDYWEKVYVKLSELAGGRPLKPPTPKKRAVKKTAKKTGKATKKGSKR